MSQPRTEAGKALLDAAGPQWNPVRAILAIEEEASRLAAHPDSPQPAAVGDCDHGEVQIHSRGRIYCPKCRRWASIDPTLIDPQPAHPDSGAEPLTRERLMVYIRDHWNATAGELADGILAIFGPAHPDSPQPATLTVERLAEALHVHQVIHADESGASCRLCRQRAIDVMWSLGPVSLPAHPDSGAEAHVHEWELHRWNGTEPAPDPFMACACGVRQDMADSGA